MDNFIAEEVNCNLCKESTAEIIFKSTIDPNGDDELGYACTNDN